jgi:hypothetical protein
MADTKKIIDRDTSQGHLTGEIPTTGYPTLTLYLNGKQVESGSPTKLEGRLARQVADAYTHRLGDYPLAASEMSRLDNAKEAYQERRLKKGRELAEQYADVEVTIERRAGTGLTLAGAADLPDALRKLLRSQLDDADLDLDPDWTGGSTKVTISDLLDHTDGDRHERPAEQVGQSVSDNSYHDPHHEMNCGARYSASAACECGAA